MVRITKVYTKTGDKGMTHLAGKATVAKTSPRINAIGDVDELNAFLGFAAVLLAKSSALKILQTKIQRIQNELFDFGAQLAILAADRRSDSPAIILADVEKLEHEIDEMNAALPVLSSFILPGGDELVARLHLARTLCRRAERAVLQLAEKENIEEFMVPYLNRLSDWLFVAARFVAQELGAKEILWQQRR